MSDEFLLRAGEVLAGKLRKKDPVSSAVVSELCDRIEELKEDNKNLTESLARSLFSGDEKDGSAEAGEADHTPAEEPGEAPETEPAPACPATCGRRRRRLGYRTKAEAPVEEHPADVNELVGEQGKAEPVEAAPSFQWVLDGSAESSLVSVWSTGPSESLLAWVCLLHAAPGRPRILDGDGNAVVDCDRMDIVDALAKHTGAPKVPLAEFIARLPRSVPTWIFVPALGTFGTYVLLGTAPLSPPLAYIEVLPDRHMGYLVQRNEQGRPVGRFCFAWSDLKDLAARLELDVSVKGSDMQCILGRSK